MGRLKLKALLLCSVLFFLSLPSISEANHQRTTYHDYPPFTVVAGGAHAGGDSVVVPMGEIIGFSDLQCGTYDPRVGPSSLDCNFGAGNGTNRGDINLNPDVGDDTFIYGGGGHTDLLAGFRDQGTTIHRRLRVCDSRGCLNVARELRNLRRELRSLRKRLASR